MNRMEKNEIYDEACKLLTDYEHSQDNGEDDTLATPEDLYSQLVVITTYWEELTGDED